MKILSNWKASLLSLMFVAFLALPVSAQYDGFFRNYMSYDNRESGVGGFLIGTQGFGTDENGGFNIATQQFGQDLPLGEGLLIMIGTGAAYAMKKRKHK